MFGIDIKNSININNNNIYNINNIFTKHLTYANKK